MRKDYKKDDMEFKFCRDYWNFVQQYAIPEHTELWWNELMDEADKLCKKYSNRQYYRDMVRDFMNEAERRYKDEK